VGNLVMLFGSGISFPSGAPCVDQITDTLLHGSKFGNSRMGSGIPLDSDGLVNCCLPELSACRELLLALKLRADAHFQAKRPHRPSTNYEDLYSLCYQLVQDDDQFTANPAIAGFSQDVRAVTEEIVSKHQSQHVFDERKPKGLWLAAIRAIAMIVWSELRQKRKPKGAAQIAYVAKRYDKGRVDIFTLNHDLLIETVLKDGEVAYTNGFAATAVPHPDGEGEHYLFDRTLFDGDIKARLFKLHGSVDWADRGRSRFDIESSMADFTGILPAPTVLIGTLNKDQAYGRGTYREMDFRLHEALYSTNTVIMSGYGWGDSGVNERVLDWLVSNNVNRILLLEQDHEFPRHCDVWTRHEIERLIGKKQILVEGKYLCDISADELMRKLS